MQQDQALGLLQAFLDANGFEAPPKKETEVDLDDVPPFQVGDDWDPELQFRFFPESGELKWYALIYEFPEAPSDKLLDTLDAEEHSGKVEMGGGTLEYDAEEQSLFLVRSYQEAVSVEQLSADVLALQQASHLWGDEVLGEAISRAGSA